MEVRTPRKHVQRGASASPNAGTDLALAARYEIRKDITEHIPEDVTRAKARAWLTLISPITQWAGLKGDQLAHKRALLRIQQEETLTNIVRRAASRIAALPAPIAPVPVKFLVHFLEKASLEEPDSRLVEMWASLLVSAAKKYDQRFVYFANIISQLSSEQGRIFEAVIGPGGHEDALLSLERLHFGFERDFVQYAIKTDFDAMKRKPVSLDKIADLVERIPARRGIVVDHIDIDDITKDDDYMGYCPEYSIFTDAKRTDFSILVGLQLLDFVDTGFFTLGNRWKIKVLYYHVTELGLSFASACGVKAPNLRRPSSARRGLRP